MAGMTYSLSGSMVMDESRKLLSEIRCMPENGDKDKDVALAVMSLVLWRCSVFPYLRLYYRRSRGCQRHHDLNCSI